MPDFIMKSNFLSCDNPFNLRTIWASLTDLNVDDITEIYREIGIISVREDANEKLSKSALVLLPKTIEKEFIKFPNVSCVENLSNLNVSCIHRENIKLLYGGPKNFISKSYPHLIKGDSLDLIDNKIKLDATLLIEIMSTCIDFANSPVNFIYLLCYLFYRISKLRKNKLQKP